jgi:hypothetical protein
MLDGLISKQTQAMRASQALGVTREQFAGLSRAAQKAGLDTDQFTRLMEHGLRTISEAGAGSSEAQHKFEDLGLNFRELKKTNPAEAFTQIATAINQLQNPMDRVRASMEIFGRGGADLLPLFAKGAEGIKQATEEAKRLGLIVNEADLAKMKEVKKTFTEIKEAIYNSLIAPLVGIGEAIAEIFPSISSAFKSFGDYLKNIGQVIFDFKVSTIMVFREITGAIMYLVDASKMVAGFVLKYMVAPLIDGFAMLVEGASSVVGALAKIPVVGKAFKGAAEGLEEFAKSVRNTARSVGETGAGLVSTHFGDARRATDSFFDDILKKAFQARLRAGQAAGAVVDRDLLNDIRKWEDELRKVNQQFGVSPDAIKRHELALRGATDEQLRHVDAMIKRREEHDKLIKDLDEAKKIMEENLTPLQKFQNEMEKLNRLYNEGMLTNDNYAKAVAKAMATVASSLKQADISLPGLAKMGSAEAITSVAKIQLQGQAPDTQKQIQMILQEQRDTQQRQLTVAQQTLQALQAVQSAQEVEF